MLSLAYEDVYVFMSGPFAEWLQGHCQQPFDFGAHAQTHRALSILRTQVGVLSPDGPEVEAVDSAIKLIAKNAADFKCALAHHGRYGARGRA